MVPKSIVLQTMSHEAVDFQSTFEKLCVSGFGDLLSSYCECLTGPERFRRQINITCFCRTVWQIKQLPRYEIEAKKERSLVIFVKCFAALDTGSRFACEVFKKRETCMKTVVYLFR